MNPYTIHHHLVKAQNSIIQAKKLAVESGDTTTDQKLAKIFHQLNKLTQATKENQQ